MTFSSAVRDPLLCHVPRTSCPCSLQPGYRGVAQVKAKYAAYAKVLKVLKTVASDQEEADTGPSAALPILVHAGVSESNAANVFATADPTVAKACHARGAGLYLRPPRDAFMHLVPPLVADLGLGFAATCNDGIPVFELALHPPSMHLGALSRKNTLLAPNRQRCRCGRCCQCWFWWWCSWR